MKVVLISGKQGSGKTTLQSMLFDQWRKRRGDAYVINFADCLYRMHDAVLRVLHQYWPKRDLVKDGPLLQLLGTEWGRNTIDEDIWVKILQKRLENFVAQGDLVIVGDCRFENEFKAVPDALRIRLECDRDVRKRRCSMWRDRDNHPSEIGLDAYAKHGKFDLYFNTAELKPEEITQLVMAQLDKDVWREKREIQAQPTENTLR